MLVDATICQMFVNTALAMPFQLTFLPCGYRQCERQFDQQFRIQHYLEIKNLI